MKREFGVVRAALAAALLFVGTACGCASGQTVNPAFDIRWPAICSTANYVWSQQLQTCIPLAAATFTLTTTGSSGAATFVGGVLNIPVYTGGGSSGFPIVLGSTSIAASSTTTALTGISINGVTLNAAGSTSLFLNQAGGYTSAGGGGSPGGSNHAVQFNSSSVFGGTAFTGIVKASTTADPAAAVAADITALGTIGNNTTGSAAKLTTARNINGIAFDGTGNITITAAPSGFGSTAGILPESDGAGGLRLNSLYFTDSDGFLNFNMPGINMVSNSAGSGGQLPGLFIQNTACPGSPAEVSANTEFASSTSENAMVVGHQNACQPSGLSALADISFITQTGFAHKVPGTSTYSVTNSQLTSNVVTLTSSNSLTAGQFVLVFNLTSVTLGPLLNNQVFTVVSASSTQFTIAFTHANVGSAAESGNAEQYIDNEIDITNQGGGIINFGFTNHTPLFSIRTGLAANGVFLPGLPSQPCLGTDSFGTIGAGTCSGGSGNSQYGSVQTFGDSITQSTGAQNFMQYGLNADGYAQDLISDFGGVGQNFGFGGDQAADMSLKVFASANPAVAYNPVTTMLISTNDVQVYGTNTDQQNIFKRAMTGSIAWAAIPDASKFLTSNTNNCTRTGSWAVHSGTPRATIFSNTNASTLSCSVTVPTGSNAIYYGYTACDSYSPGQATITINGVSPSNDATVLSYGQAGALIFTANRSECAYMVARYTEAPGTYTFLITVSGSALVEPQWLGSPLPAAATTVAPPIVLVGGTPWNNGNSPSTTTAAYNTIISNLVTSMAADSAPVYFVDIRNGTNTRNSATTTPLNSSTDYAGGIQGTITCPASTNLPLHPNSSTTWSRSCGMGHLAGNFEAAMGIPVGGPQTSPVAYGRLLAPNGFDETQIGYGLTVNGDLRVGSMAGIAFGSAGDTYLHVTAPVTSGGIAFDIGNSPSPGVAPTIVTPAIAKVDGFHAITDLFDANLISAPCVATDGSGKFIVTTCGSGGSILVQTNTVSNTLQTTLNMETSTANSVGLTITPSNPSGGIEKWEISGVSYTGNAATATALASVPTQCTGGTPLATGIAANGNANCTANNLPVCSDVSASGTAQSCTTSPSFTPVAGSCVVYTTTTSNSGASLMLNVNGLGAKPVAKWLGNTTLSILPNPDVKANSPQVACYSGAVWALSTIGNDPPVLSVFGRTGTVTATSGDYTAAQVTGAAVHVANGTSALGTGAISSATCATVVTTTATGTATTDVVGWGFNGDVTAVTGYAPVTTGALTIFAYPSSGNVNFKVCNLTTASITPGAITLNWTVIR